MRIHEPLQQQQHLLHDTALSQCAERNAGAACALQQSQSQSLQLSQQLKSATSTTPATTTTTTSIDGSAHWRQLRQLMQQLTRGMRSRPVVPQSMRYDSRGDISAATSGNNNGNLSDALLLDVAPGTSMLHKDFWLEALDPQHRYGFHLRAFHRVWKDAMATRPTPSSTCDDPRNNSFFYWLDHGAGRTLELPECSRDALETLRVEYCDEHARRAYEVEFVSPSTGDQSTASVAPVAVYAATQALVQTDEQSKWIFVVALDGKLYVGRKRKGAFHHSSFVAGAPILAAGKLMVKHGRIVAIEPHSGHFKPTLRNLAALCRVLHAAHVDVASIVFVKPKKWTSAWPFVDHLPPRLAGCELEDLESDTDYCSYKSDSDDP